MKIKLIFLAPVAAAFLAFLAGSSTLAGGFKAPVLGVPRMAPSAIVGSPMAVMTPRLHGALAVLPAPRLLPGLMPLALPPLSRIPVEAAKGAGDSGFDKILAAPMSFKAQGSGSSSKSSSRSSSRRAMPDPESEPAADPMDLSDLDELGNPRRRQSEGPDTVSDEFSGGERNNSPLF